MSKFIINGGKKLSGEVKISGSKNAALPIVCATVLNKGITILKNIPDIADIHTLVKILEFLGAKIKFEKNILEIDNSNLENKFIPIELVYSLRGAILLLGPLLARFGKAEMAQPGGCVIGKRPTDAHLNAFKDMGCEILESDQNLRLKVKEKSKNCKLKMSEISVTGTENALCFTSSKDFCEISMCASEPHVQDLCHFLEKLGAKIEGIGSHYLRIKNISNCHSEGSTTLTLCINSATKDPESKNPTKDFSLNNPILDSSLCSEGQNLVEHEIIPDYLEVGTFAVAAAITGGNLKIKGANEGDLDAFWLKMSEAGVKFKHSENEVEIFENNPKNFKAVKIQTAVFPSFPTDLQAPFAILQTMARGKSEIFETLFERRLNFLFELEKMGCEMEIQNPHQAIIHGGKQLKGAEVTSCDLRAGAAVVLAGLIAKGETTVLNIKYIDRGYENFEEKLKKLGAEIKRIN